MCESAREFCLWVCVCERGEKRDLTLSLGGISLSKYSPMTGTFCSDGKMRCQRGVRYIHFPCFWAQGLHPWSASVELLHCCSFVLISVDCLFFARCLPKPSSLPWTHISLPAGAPPNQIYDMNNRKPTDLQNILPNLRHLREELQREYSAHDTEAAKRDATIVDQELFVSET